MKLIIHATNVTGLGAAQVVCSILGAIDQGALPCFNRVTCYLPDSGPVAEFNPQSSRIEKKTLRRRLPKAISRVVECLFPGRFFEYGDVLLVLGDVPLRWKGKQIVFLHQPNLLSPKVNKYSSNHLTYKLMRFLTKLNARYASKVVVQTNAMLEAVQLSYKIWNVDGAVQVVKQPPPAWFEKENFEYKLRPEALRHGLKLFYPAAVYPHKNHQLLRRLCEFNWDDSVLNTIFITATSAELGKFKKSCIHCLGRLTVADCMEQYRKSDALIFPSFLESYGLPLVEAMSIGMPILAADLPYSRTLCGSEAIYFDPQSQASLAKAIHQLHERLNTGWKPDWKQSLDDLPSDWNAVANLLIRKRNLGERKIN